MLLLPVTPICSAMIIRLAARYNNFIVKRFIRGLPLNRDGVKSDESPPDPFMMGTVSRKTDISGEYLMTEEVRQETVQFWASLSEDKKKLDNEENLQEIPVGTVRRDSANRPRYHGQYEPANPKFTMDERAYEAAIASRRIDVKPADTASDSCEMHTEQAQDKLVEPASEVEVVNVDDFFPNRKSLTFAAKPEIGKFTFKHTDEWFDSEQANRATDVHQPFSSAPPSHYGLKTSGEPDMTVIAGLKFAQESPIKSMAEMDEEIEAISNEVAAEPADDSTDEEEEEDGEQAAAVAENAPDEASKLEEEKKKMTAFDYVQKLRKGELKPESEKLQQAFDTANVNALDSQGFYSYKGYAPDLSQYRRSELIWNLKKSILFCDADVLAINKPYGLIVQGKEKNDDSHAPVLTDLLDEFADLLLREKLISEPKKLRTVHRLDKETTGVLLLAMSEEKAAFLQKSFEERNISKTYHAITKSVPDPRQGIIDIPIEQGSVDGKERMVLRPELREEFRRISHPSKHARRAVTEFRILSEKGNAALIEIKPVTGVKHQVRVHMGFGMRCPILGDHKYTYLDRIAPQKLPSDMLLSLNVRPSKVRNIPMHLFSKMMIIPGAGTEGKTIYVKAFQPQFFTTTLKRLKLEID